jgi:hypothetical protein
LATGSMRKGQCMFPVFLSPRSPASRSRCGSAVGSFPRALASVPYIDSPTCFFFHRPVLRESLPDPPAARLGCMVGSTP